MRLQAQVVATFRTSMEIEVDVTGEDTVTGEVWPTVEARVVFVADRRVAQARRPSLRLMLETEDDRAAQSAAEERRQARASRRDSVAACAMQRP